MVHTLPDYTTKYKLATIFSHIDEAELAARLGSPIIWDRRGNVIWYDTINSTGNKWNLSHDGTGSAAAVSSTVSMYGDYSMKLTGGSDGLKYGAMNKKFQLIQLGNLGLESTFSLDTNIDYFVMQFEYRSDGIVKDGRIKVDKTNERLQYLNSAAAYVTFATDIDFNVDITQFFTLKLVVDIKNNEYVRVIFGNNEYDLIGIPVRTYASVAMGYFAIYLLAYSAGASNGISYVDNVIVTQNET